MPRRIRTDAVLDAPDEPKIERQLRDYIICRWARVPGDDEIDAKDALVAANVHTHRSEPPADRLAHLRALLGDLGILDGAERHHDYMERFRREWELI
jgi:hypothetical protein